MITLLLINCIGAIVLTAGLFCCTTRLYRYSNHLHTHETLSHFTRHSSQRDRTMEPQELQISTRRLCRGERERVATTIRQDGRRHRRWSQSRESGQATTSGTSGTSRGGELHQRRHQTHQRRRSRAQQNVHQVLHTISRRNHPRI